MKINGGNDGAAAIAAPALRAQQARMRITPGSPRAVRLSLRLSY